MEKAMPGAFNAVLPVAFPLRGFGVCNTVEEIVELTKFLGVAFPLRGFGVCNKDIAVGLSFLAVLSLHSPCGDLVSAIATFFSPCVARV